MSNNGVMTDAEFSSLLHDGRDYDILASRLLEEREETERIREDRDRWRAEAMAARELCTADGLALSAPYAAVEAYAAARAANGG